MNRTPRSARRRATRQLLAKLAFAWFRSVLGVHRIRLFANVHRVGRVHLHPKRHLVLRDARHGFGISECGVSLLVNVINGVQHVAAQCPAYTVRIVEIEHRLAVGAALHSLVHAGKEARTPQLLSAIGRLATGKQHDKAWQVLILSAQTIHHPRSERCVSEPRIPCLHQQLCWSMIELVRAHGLDETDIVKLFLDVRQTVRNPLTALSRLMKRVLRSEELRNTADEGEPLPGEERSRTILPIKPF